MKIFLKESHPISISKECWPRSHYKNNNKLVFPFTSIEIVCKLYALLVEAEHDTNQYIALQCRGDR
jgi:hypothetical protein